MPIVAYLIGMLFVVLMIWNIRFFSTRVFRFPKS